MKRIVKIVLIMAAVLAAASAVTLLMLKKDAKPYISDTKFLLNTVCSVSLYDKQDSRVLRGAFGVISHYEALFSATVEGSDIYKINHADGAAVTVDPDTVDVIRQSLAYSEMSGGLFDISIGALTTLWNIEGVNPTVPPEDKIRAAVKTIGYTGILITGDTVSGWTITLKNKDAQLDLGGVAKGYIADKVRDFLKSRGVGQAIVNLGGNVEVLGSKADNTPWAVGVQQPFVDGKETVGTLYLSDKSVVTSGIYERYFVQDGTLYAHILDPRTGYPVDNNLSSVTIVSDNSKQGDGLAATCFLLGVEEATRLVESMDDIQAVFITKEGRIITTKGIGDQTKFVPSDTMRVSPELSGTSSD